MTAEQKNVLIKKGVECAFDPEGSPDMEKGLELVAYVESLIDNEIEERDILVQEYRERIGRLQEAIKLLV